MSYDVENPDPSGKSINFDELKRDIEKDKVKNREENRPSNKSSIEQKIRERMFMEQRMHDQFERDFNHAQNIRRMREKNRFEGMRENPFSGHGYSLRRDDNYDNDDILSSDYPTVIRYRSSRRLDDDFDQNDIFQQSGEVGYRTRHDRMIAKREEREELLRRNMRMVDMERMGQMERMRMEEGMRMGARMEMGARMRAEMDIREMMGREDNFDEKKMIRLSVKLDKKKKTKLAKNPKLIELKEKIIKALPSNYKLTNMKLVDISGSIYVKFKVQIDNENHYRLVATFNSENSQIMNLKLYIKKIVKLDDDLSIRMRVQKTVERDLIKSFDNIEFDYYTIRNYIEKKFLKVGRASSTDYYVNGKKMIL